MGPFKIFFCNNPFYLNRFSQNYESLKTKCINSLFVPGHSITNESNANHLKSIFNKIMPYLILIKYGF